MPISKLRTLLEERKGEEEFHFTIPHPFLPPRYQKTSQSRNMVLFIDLDLTLHVRWEGAKTYTPHPLTPRAACHLINEVLNRMAKYRRELRTFSRFVDQRGELPFDDDRNEGFSGEREEPSAELEQNVAEDAGAEALVPPRHLHRPHLIYGKGGESPLPTEDLLKLPPGLILLGDSFSE